MVGSRYYISAAAKWLEDSARSLPSLARAAA